MRRRVIIGGTIVASALWIIVIAFLHPVKVSGKFPGEFSDLEKRQIIAAAHSDGLKQTLFEIRRGQFRQAWRWFVNSRKQTVRGLGNQQEEGMIWVSFGVDDPREQAGYFLWARYIMKKEKGHWVINGSYF